MTSPNKLTALGARLKTERRKQRLSLRDLADETGISLNTLSRVERGYMPDLKNYQKIVDWLGVPADTFLDADIDQDPIETPEVIARHLRADSRLGPAAAAKIVSVVQEMYESSQRNGQQSQYTCAQPKPSPPKLERCSRSILSEMQQNLLAESNR